MAEIFTPLTVVTLDGSLISAVNTNFSTLATLLNDVLSRSGVTPNQMSFNIDMNSNRILNLPAPSTLGEPARLTDVVTNPTVVVPPTGTSGLTVPFLSGNNTWSGTNTFNAAVTFGSTVNINTLSVSTNLNLVSSGLLEWNLDTFIGRVSAAVFSLGGPDIAAPIAQSLQVQSVVAGTLNTIGQPLTINLSKSTGNVLGGSFIVRGTPAGVSGTVQNTYANSMILTSAGSLTVLGDYSGGRIFSNDGGNAVLRGAATGTWQLGDRDAAAPIAQTLQVQSVVAGTLNTSAPDFTVNLSKSTGTGNGGRLIIQGALPGSSGTTQNALTQSFLIDPANGVITSQNTVLILSSGPSSGGAIHAGASSFFGWNGAGGFLQISAVASLQLNSNGFLTSPAAATWQLGAADAASPVAQTLQVQNVVAGTSNTAGTNWTINLSRSTGSGVGGSLIFQATPAGGSGTSQNTLIPIFAIQTNGVGLYGSTSGIISILAQPAAGTYNFNLPITAGTAGQGLVSSGGGSTAMAWVPSSRQFIYTASAVNFNSANTDTSIAITLPPGYTRYEVAAVSISHASASISSATAGVFTAAAGGGTAICATQALTVTSAADGTVNNAMGLTVTNSNTASYTVSGFGTLFFRVTLAQGSAATADVTISLSVFL